MAADNGALDTHRRNAAARRGYFHIQVTRGDVRPFYIRPVVARVGAGLLFLLFLLQ